MTNLAKLLDSKYSLTTEEGILGVVSECLEMEQVDCPVTHHFGPGIYIREVKMPAGTFSIGHFQKKEHLNYFKQGKVRMAQEDGSTKDIQAPMLFTAPPGRKVGLILEDMVWWNIYPTDETDIETLEDTYLDKAEVWKDKANQLLLACSKDNDYEVMLKDLGATEEQVREESEIEDDLIPFPFGSFNVSVSDSAIEGKGLFATAPFTAGDIIAPASLNGKRTPAGRYTNHSGTHNAKFVIMNGDLLLVATKDIEGCHGGMLGDEITIDYRQAYSLRGYYE